MVIGLLRSKASTLPEQQPAAGGQYQGLSDPGSSKDPVVRLSQLLGQTSMDAEGQQCFKKALELATAAALAAFDSVGFLESLAVCTDEEKALQRFQERHACAIEAFNAALLQHCSTTPATAEQQQQLQAAQTQLEATLCDVAAAATQQVRAAAAVAAARGHTAAASAASLKVQQQAVAAGLQVFKQQLQHVEDSCSDLVAAKQACQAAADQQVKAFRSSLLPHSTSSASSTNSSVSCALLLLKADLDKHTAHVLEAVKHRAAALACEAQQDQALQHHNQAAAHTPTVHLRPVAGTASIGQQHNNSSSSSNSSSNSSSSSSDTAALLQQAQAARAARQAADREALHQASEQAVQLMQHTALQLQQQHFSNIFLAGKAAEDACTKAHAHFVHLAAQQHSFAPDSEEYQQQLQVVEAAVADIREQLMAGLQAAASALVSTATVIKA